MSFSFSIARRYILSKSFLWVLLTLPFWPILFLLRALLRSKLPWQFNAIHIITAIATVGIAVGAAALLLVLSVFNGFEELFMGMFNKFNPDVRIEAATGKYFDTDTLVLSQLRNTKGIAHVSETLEEVAFFEYAGIQDFGIIKGIDANYAQITRLDTTVHEGKFEIQVGDHDMAVMGAGMRGKLAVNLDNFYAPISVYMPKNGNQIAALEAPFRKQLLYPSGVFTLQQEADNEYIITNLPFVEALLDRYGQRSALEVAFSPEANTKTIAKIEKIMGDKFVIKDRYRQDESFLKLMNIEKWMSFAILSLTLVLVAFNMVGCMWMIVLDKRRDIAIMRSMGAQTVTIRNIFLQTGLMLSLLGLLIGFGVAVLLFFLQKKYSLISVPVGFIIDAYPIAMRPLDFMIVAATVLGIGILAAWPASRRAMRVDALIREE